MADKEYSGKHCFQEAKIMINSACLWGGVLFSSTETASYLPNIHSLVLCQNTEC